MTSRTLRPVWSKPPRTGADRLADLDNFLALAQDRMVLAATAEELAARYGVKDRKAVEYKLTIAQNRIRAREGVA